MAFEFLINSVQEEHVKRYSEGTVPVMGDTICLVCSENGTVYKGYNTVSDSGEAVHAEVAAVNSMRSDGQTMIRAITVFDSFSGVTVIPCNACLHMILTVDYRNINTVISTPTGTIPVAQFLGASQPPVQGIVTQHLPFMNSHGKSQNTSMYMTSGVPVGIAAYMNMINNKPGEPVYMNRSIQQNSVTSGFAAGVSVSQNSVSGIAESPAAPAVPRSYTAGGSAKSNLLKSKLSELLGDDDE